MRIRVLILVSTLCWPTPHAVAQLQTWTLEPELRIGAVDDSIAGFTSIIGLESDARGRIYVLQRGVPEIRVFDSAGRYAGNLGRGGAGPGEFVRPWALGWIADTLWILDSGQSRISFFRDLEHIRDQRIPRLEDDRSISPVGFLPGGLMVAVPVLRGQDLDAGVTKLPVIRVAGEGLVLDTIAFVDFDNAVLLIPYDGGNRTLSVANPYSAHDVFTLSKDARAFVVLERNRSARQFGLTAIDVLSSDTLFSRIYPFRARRVSRAQVAEHVDGLAKAARLGPVRRRLVHERLLEASRRPAAVNAALAATDGSLWLVMNSGDAEGKYLVVDRSGEPQAWVRTEASVIAIGRTTVWAVQTDGLGVQYLVRHHIKR